MTPILETKVHGICIQMVDGFLHMFFVHIQQLVVVEHPPRVRRFKCYAPHMQSAYFICTMRRLQVVVLQQHGVRRSQWETVVPAIQNVTRAPNLHKKQKKTNVYASFSLMTRYRTDHLTVVSLGAGGVTTSSRYRIPGFSPTNMSSTFFLYTLVTFTFCRPPSYSDIKKL